MRLVETDADGVTVVEAHGRLDSTTSKASRNPTTGIAGCCALAANGHPAAVPTSSVTNSRRFMCGWVRRETGGR
jgi:hypothetical protein